jgi:hypothetical protein
MGVSSCWGLATRPRLETEAAGCMNPPVSGGEELLQAEFQQIFRGFELDER